MTTEPRQLAIVRDYDSLHVALRARADELNVSRESIDDAAGFQSGYSGKLLAGTPIKRLGAVTMGPMLTVLGLMLVVVEDPDAIERFTTRLTKREHAGNDVLAVGRRKKRRRYPKLGPEWGRRMRARQMLLQSATKRKQIARKAARARWGSMRMNRG
jgi:hypothetical protein